MRIHLTSVFVDDQDKALAFYTEILGFQKKTEIPMGEVRWLTVVSQRRSRRHGARARAKRSSGRGAVQGGARDRRHPVHVVRGRRRAEGVRAAPGTRCSVRPGAGRDGSGHDRRVRRHVRQPAPDRGQELAPNRRHPGSFRSSSSQRARSFSSRRTAAAVVLVNGSSSWTASTRSTPALRSAVASTLPTNRSRCRTGSA